MAANRRHLQCINGHYRYRRRWPKGIRAVAQGEFFIRHLGTSSLADALRLRPAVEIEFFSEVDRLSGLVDNAPREISQAEATMLVSRWFAEQIKRDAEYDLTQSIRDREERLAAIEAKGYSWLVVYPEQRLVVALNTNARLDDFSDFMAIEQAITRTFFTIRSEGD